MSVQFLAGGGRGSGAPNQRMPRIDLSVLRYVAEGVPFRVLFRRLHESELTQTKAKSMVADNMQ